MEFFVANLVSTSTAAPLRSSTKVSMFKRLPWGEDDPVSPAGTLAGEKSHFPWLSFAPNDSGILR